MDVNHADRITNGLLGIIAHMLPTRPRRSDAEIVQRLRDARTAGMASEIPEGETDADVLHADRMARGTIEARSARSTSIISLRKKQNLGILGKLENLAYRRPRPVRVRGLSTPR